MEPALRRAPNAAGGCPWTHVSRSSHAAPGASGGLRPDARLFGPVERGPPPQRRARDALPGRSPTISQRPQIRRDDPLNLSILLSGGKETNKDSPSSGERRGKSPAPNPRLSSGRGKCGVQKTSYRPVSFGGLNPSDRGPSRGWCEAGNGPRRAGVTVFSESGCL